MRTRHTLRTHIWCVFWYATELSQYETYVYMDLKVSYLVALTDTWYAVCLLGGYSFCALHRYIVPVSSLFMLNLTEKF